MLDLSPHTWKFGYLNCKVARQQCLICIGVKLKRKKAQKEKRFLSNYAKHLSICNWIKTRQLQLSAVANRDETKLIDIIEAVVPVDLPESVNVAKAVELIEAKI